MTRAEEEPFDGSWNMVEESIFRLFDSAAAEEDRGHVRLGPRLAELGWSDVEAEYARDATELLFRARARSLVHSDCLDRLMIAELSPVLDAPVDAVVLPGIAASSPSGTASVSGIVIGPSHGTLVAASSRPDGTVHIGLVEATSLTSERIDSFDASCEWTKVTGVAEFSEIDAVLYWDNAVAAARCGLSTELVELGSVIVGLAASHMRTRTQFGRPIGAFQAPRHALAEVHARLEGARALTAEAWRSGGEFAALVAKAAAGNAHREAANTAIQVCGAIGLTVEHDLHRYVARGMQLDALLGSSRQLEAALADRLVLPAAGEPLPGVISVDISLIT